MKEFTFIILSLLFLKGNILNATDFNLFLTIKNNSNQISTNNENTIHKTWDLILKKYVNEIGQVNYIGIKKDEKKLNSYLALLSNNTPIDSWSKEEKMAYWINAYNAFTVKLVIDHYPISSIKEIKNAWDNSFIILGDKSYSLNEIEHKILRKMNDPRIHFAIVCASISCPKLQTEAFTASKLNHQLDDATKDFLLDTSKNIITSSTIELSKIFKWFAKDFKEDGTLIDFLNKYSEISISKKAKKSFKEYDWNLNE